MSLLCRNEDRTAQPEEHEGGASAACPVAFAVTPCRAQPCSQVAASAAGTQASMLRVTLTNTRTPWSACTEARAEGAVCVPYELQSGVKGSPWMIW